MNWIYSSSQNSSCETEAGTQTKVDKTTAGCFHFIPVVSTQTKAIKEAIPEERMKIRANQPILPPAPLISSLPSAKCFDSILQNKTAAPMRKISVVSIGSDQEIGFSKGLMRNGIGISPPANKPIILTNAYKPTTPSNELNSLRFLSEKPIKFMAANPDKHTNRNILSS